MKWATALFGDEALTILAIFVGSDATQVKNRGSAHPIYISLLEYGADWMKWATALFGDAALTILAIFVGSDATQVKNRGSAHPIYISLGQVQF